MMNAEEIDALTESLAAAKAENARLKDAAVKLAAWQSAFGTTQLTHALAKLESANAENVGLRAEVEILRMVAAGFCDACQEQGDLRNNAEAKIAKLQAVVDKLRRGVAANLRQEIFDCAAEAAKAVSNIDHCSQRKDRA